jgi:hypothetical protein
MVLNWGPNLYLSRDALKMMLANFFLEVSLVNWQLEFGRAVGFDASEIIPSC